VQAPRQYYMLCHEVYQKAGLKQLHTDTERSVVTDAENLWLQMQKRENLRLKMQKSLSKDLWLQMHKSKEANCEVDARI